MDVDSDSKPLIGEAPAFLAVLEHVSRAAPLSRPLLVVGERGTGKEQIAARLHFLSTRWQQPLVRINCAALTESLLESELFGHEAGAFTGASARRLGCFEQADGGTLVLDELGTIPLRTQEKVLRVIEYGEFQRLGASGTQRVTVRVIGVTNEDLPAAVADGRFRADLLDRLAFDVIRVPPLRERRDDILPLALHFAMAMTAELQRPLFAGFDRHSAAALCAHAWPGNVRELKNAVERSVYRATRPDEPLHRIEFDPFGEAASETPRAPAAGAPGGTGAGSGRLPLDLKRHLADVEQTLIGEAMERAAYDQRAAAELLGLSYHQLRAALRRHDLVGRYGRGRARRDAGTAT